jgi:YjbE family integral membrane protein
MGAESVFLGFTATQLALLGQVIMINFVLSGDNAVVVGMAAAGLPAKRRTQALWFGIVAATVLRIGFAVIAVNLLQVPGLMFAGGLLLFWVSWNLWREIVEANANAEESAEAGGTTEVPKLVVAAEAVTIGEIAMIAEPVATKTFQEAIWQILVADVSMSLDNVLAVAGAAQAEPTILMIGLIVSVLLMGIAATAIAKLLERYRWIAWVGLALIVFVAVEMCWKGGKDLLELVGLA